MSINKIKLKQIDADFSGLVGEYGSGYFASIGSFNSLSGSAVKYQDIATGGFIYNTGNQSISGVKNFLSRPQLSGVGLVTLQEVVTLTGGETISGGQKTFLSDVTFDENDTTFQFGEIQFTEVEFSLDSNSASSLVGNLGGFIVNTITDQAVSGIKNFTDGIKVNNTGVLLSGQIHPVYVNSGANTSVQKHIVFADGEGSGFKNLENHTGLTYQADNGVLRTNIFSGIATRLSGKNPIATINGSVFDGSSDIVIRPSGREDAANENRFLLFTSGNTAGYKDVFFDSNITVNPSFNSIAASTFVGGFSGNALNSTSSAGLSLAAFNASDNINFQFPANTSVYQMNSGFFAPVADNTIGLGQLSRRWSTVFAGTAAINTSDANLKQDVSEIPDEWLDAWEEINYVKYKFKDAVDQKGLSGARWHVGLIAQDIYEKFNSRGLDAFEIGMLCYDKWDEYVDVNGTIIPSGEIWSIRPDECQFMEMALTRRTINRLKSGILI